MPPYWSSIEAANTRKQVVEFVRDYVSGLEGKEPFMPRTARLNLPARLTALNTKRTSTSSFQTFCQTWHYYKCLTDLISAAAETARRFNALPAESVDVGLEFTFDSRDQSDGTAKAVYRTFRSQPKWQGDGMLGQKIDFKDTFDYRLDMADLFAREAMKELNRKLTGTPQQPRKSFLALDGASKDGTKQFHFRERDRAYCQRWRATIDQPGNQALMRRYGDWIASLKPTKRK